uniref:Septum formation-related domain-containing protein n=1 Tax=Streptomyces sp. NBC_01401 TaxID=2903854 RepID=A0AAU3GT20_9ACTN
MSTETPRKGRRVWLVAAAVCALAAVAGVTTATNTNALGPNDLCDGRLSSADAGKAFDGFGRVTGKTNHADGCVVEQSGWLPGAKGARVTLAPMSVNAVDPFGRSVWDISGAQNILPGALPGAFDQHGNGWVSLPSDCASVAAGTAQGSRTVLHVNVEQGDADPAELARMAQGAARKLAAEHDCAPPTPEPENAGTDLLEASAVTRSDPAAVCGLTGFTLAATAPAGSPLQEQTSGSRDDAWFCDLSLEELATGLDRDQEHGAFARFAIIQNPALLAGAKERKFEHSVCGGKETYFATDSLTFEWASPDTQKERAAASFFAESDAWARFTAAARAALDCG